DDLQLVWLNREGKIVEKVPAAPGAIKGIDLAADGRIAVHRHQKDGGDIFVIDPAATFDKPLTFSASRDNSSPVWSPDRSRVAFSARRNGKFELLSKRSDGSGDEESLLVSERPMAPTSWSKDGI